MTSPCAAADMGAAPEVFGVPLEGGDVGEVLEAAVHGGRPFWIVTANPEILLAADEDPSYAETLRRASWRTVDGAGLAWVLRARGSACARLTGVDLAEALLREAARRGWRVAGFGGDPSVARDAEAAWRARLPGLAFRVFAAGTVGRDGAEDGASAAARAELEAWRPDIVLVALGAPKQERWIDARRGAWPGVRIVVGVGGAFDMWAGRHPRAPRAFRALGIEWAWRLLLEPRRARRIWRAVAVFPWRALVRGRAGGSPSSP